MPTIADLPLVNATLNGIAAVLLTVGFVFIRRRDTARHHACMVAAFATSALFLASYLVYHAHAGSRPFQGTGTIRLVYFAILLTHIVLAAAIVPMAIVTLARGWTGQYERHRQVARWTLPVWLYVSVTGVVIYLMLYRL